MKEANRERYFDGYDSCMEEVIRTLVKCDEVRIGNLIINEPNAYVANTVFFILDPNLVIIDVSCDATNMTVVDNTFSCMVSDDFKDRFKPNEVEQ